MLNDCEKLRAAKYPEIGCCAVCHAPDEVGKWEKWQGVSVEEGDFYVCCALWTEVKEDWYENLP